MSSVCAPVTDESYIISASKRPNVELVLRDRGAGTNYDVVDCSDEILREKLRARGPGSVVRADIAPADPDGETWLITRLRPGAPPRVGPSL